ncbi:DUF1598 domain-containing protein [Pseudobythopirellula maris]|nr:DUF1598 domain-containing protein [Pseudobythopirellula maris]
MTNLFRVVACTAALALVSASADLALAQFGGGGGQGGGGGGGLGGGGGGAGGGITGSGVVVDADGVVHRTTVSDTDGSLARRRAAEAMSRLEGDLAKPSKLRKVSLPRLERALKERLAAGQQPDDTMESLAGLTRIDYVLCYPPTSQADAGDIVLAGPAEPWGEAPNGKKLGVETGAPVIELQDLATALRAFPAGSSDAPLIYCSIDPTAEGLSRMQQFLAEYGRSATPGDTQFIVEQLRERLGLQIVTVGGVPAETHFAQVLVEADYRMKLIGIGLEKPPVRLKSYVARANPAAVSQNALQRWFFVPDYERLRVSQDGLAMEIVGDGVKLVGEDEVVTRDGARRGAGHSNRASVQFTKTFTKQYNNLAERAPVYAQLRNCIDLAVAAAFMQKHDFYNKADWQVSALNDESAYSVEKYNAPQQVATAVNSIWKGHTLMTPIGGGVVIKPADALEQVNLRIDEEGATADAHAAVVPSSVEADKWWWD